MKAEKEFLGTLVCANCENFFNETSVTVCCSDGNYDDGSYDTPFCKECCQMLRNHPKVNFQNYERMDCD